MSWRRRIACALGRHRWEHHTNMAGLSSRTVSVCYDCGKRIES